MKNGLLFVLVAAFFELALHVEVGLASLIEEG